MTYGLFLRGLDLDFSKAEDQDQLLVFVNQFSVNKKVNFLQNTAEFVRVIVSVDGKSKVAETLKGNLSAFITASISPELKKYFVCGTNRFEIPVAEVNKLFETQVGKRNVSDLEVGLLQCAIQYLNPETQTKSALSLG